MACKAVNKVCQGRLKGAKLGAMDLIFEPGEIAGGDFEFDIGTAGAVTLVAQSIIPLLLKASKESKVTIIGGTHVMKSPGFDYFAQVFLPAMVSLGAHVKSQLIKPGYYPKGGGVIELFVKPSTLKGSSDWSMDENARAIIRLAKLPSHIAEREKNILKENDIHDISIYEEASFSPGNAVTVWQGFKGAYALGERGKKAELVAQEAVDDLHSESRDVDTHLADQLLIYAAMSAGKTSYQTSKITEHLRTNAYVIERFTKRKISLGDGLVEVV